MAFDELTSFLQAATDAEDLLRVSEPVETWDLLRKATRTISSLHGSRSPVLFVEQPVGLSMPIVTNLLGSPDRMLRSLSAPDFETVADRMFETFVPGSPAPSSSETGGLWERPRSLTPRIGRRAVCQQVIKLQGDFDLSQLPFQVNAIGKDCSVVAVLLGEDQRTRLSSMTIISDGDSRLILTPQNSTDRKQLLAPNVDDSASPIPVAIVLGGDPLLSYASSLPIPRGVDAFHLLGSLRSEPLTLVRGRSVELFVPADAEIVIEGYVEPSLEPNSIVMDVVTVTHRANPILPWIDLSATSYESGVCSLLNQEIALRWLRLWSDDVTGVTFPELGEGESIALVSLRENTDQSSMPQLANTLLSLPMLRRTSIFVVVVGDAPRTSELDIIRQIANAVTHADGGSDSPLLLAKCGNRFVLRVHPPTIRKESEGDAGDQARCSDILRKAGWSVRSNADL